MQRQLKNLRENIAETWKRLEGRKEQKTREYLQEESYLEDSQQESYLGGQIRDMIKNIGEDLRGTGKDRKKNE